MPDYASEAAMYPILFDHLRAQGSHVLRQVPVGFARADFIAFALDWDEVRRRAAAGVVDAVTQPSGWRLLLDIEATGPAATTELAARLKWSGGYVRSLCEGLRTFGILNREGSTWSIRFRPRLLFTAATVVEAKLHDWQRAVVQAFRYAIYLPEAYVALPQRQAEALASQVPPLLARTGVGVMSVNGRVDVLRPSAAYEPAQSATIQRHVLSELAWRSLVDACRRFNDADRHRRWLPVNPENVPSDVPEAVESACSPRPDSRR